MTKSCRKYTLETISMFIDMELPEAEFKALSAHIEQCEACAEQVKNLQQIATKFDHIATAEVDRLKKTRFNITAGQFASTLTFWNFGRIFKFMREHMSVKVASVAAIAIVTILAVFQGTEEIYPKSPGPGNIAAHLSGSSAIVTSVDTNYSSIMIFETKKEKHTIIWFSNT